MSLLLLYCKITIQSSDWVPLRISCGCRAWQGYDVLNCDSIGHIVRCSSLNSGQCQCGTPWRHWCENTWMSVNMLHSLERHVENPCRTREKGRRENEMCYRRGKKAHCVNDMPQRDTRTLHCHGDIHFLVGSLLPKIWQTLWCFHRE